MHAWFSPLRARASLFFSSALILAGLVPVLYLAGVFVWQVIASMQAGKWIALPISLLFTEHAYAFLPKVPWAWFATPDSMLPLHNALAAVLGRVHAGALFGIVGLALVAVGVCGVLKQRAALRAYRQWREDRARRVEEYRRDDTHADAFGRREPIFVQYPAEPLEPPAKERWSARG